MTGESVRAGGREVNVCYKSERNESGPERLTVLRPSIGDRSQWLTCRSTAIMPQRARMVNEIVSQFEI